MKCPICEGKGGWTEIIDPEIGGPYFRCWTCNQTGGISLLKRLSIWFWESAPVKFVEWYGDTFYPYNKEETHND